MMGTGEEFEPSVRARPAPRWRIGGGIIQFTVVSNELYGMKWIRRFTDKNVRLGGYLQLCILKYVVPSPPFMSMQIEVLRGECFGDHDHTDICIAASELGLVKPSYEVGCLIREMFSDQEILDMGFDQLIVMHETDEDPTYGETTGQFGITVDDSGPSLGMYNAVTKKTPKDRIGFAFLRLKPIR